MSRLINNLERGSLKSPSAVTLKSTYMCVIKFEKLFDNFYNALLTHENQLHLLLKISEPNV